jgi:hypothetical protein
MDAMADIAEQIRAFEEKRASLVAANEAIMQKAADEGSTLDAEQEETFDNNQADVEAIDKHLKRLRAMEKTAATKAVPVVGGSSDDGGNSRGGQIVVKSQPKLAPGLEFARLAQVKAISRLDGERMTDVALAMYGENSNVYGILKATVAAGTTVSGNWAEALVSTEGGPVADFLEYLRPATILGKFGTDGIPALRSIPHNRRIVEQTGGGAAYWVGEAKPKPLTSFDFEGTTVPLLKVANIAVLSEEVIRDSDPGAQAIVRDSLRNALVERLDIDFVDPAKSASAGVSPASVTNGSDTIAASGTGDPDDVRLDVRSLKAKFRAANNPASSSVFLMSGNTADALSMAVNALGQPEFSSITATGGTFMNRPVIVSDYISDANVILLNASDIYLVEGGGINIDLSREASLEMKDSGLTQDQPTGVALVSMFQNNLVALRAERAINWAKRRPEAVTYLTGVAWGGSVNT